MLLHPLDDPTGSPLPHFVGRVAGLPVEVLDGLRANRSVELADTILRRREKLSARAVGLSDTVYHLVPASENRVRRRLIRLRRDLFNLRCPREGDRAVLHEDLAAEVADFVAELDAVDQLVEVLRKSLEEEEQGISEALLGGFDHPDLRAGLRLSSRSLFNRIADSSPLLATDRKLERGLLRYFTRTAGKSTPFGRLCAIAHGRLASSRNDLSLDGDPQEKYSQVRANKRLFSAVLEHVVEDEAARRQLPLRLNPTLVQEGDQLVFLAVFDEREAFQTVALNPAIDAVVALLRENKGSVLSLAKEVVALPKVDTTVDEAASYLDQLRDYGLLQIDLPGVGHAPDWPREFASVLAECRESQAAQDAHDFLVHLSEATERIRSQGTASPAGETQLTQLESKVADVLDGWDTKRRYRFAGPPIYEDAGTAVDLVVDRRHFASAMDSLSALLAHLQPMSWLRQEHLRMWHYHAQSYDGRAVPILDFYRDYYRDVIKPEEESKEKQAATKGVGAAAEGEGTEEKSGEEEAPIPSEEESTTARAFLREPAAVASLRGAHAKLSELLRRRWAEGQDEREFELDRSDLAEIIRGVPPLPKEPRSLSAFVTFVRDPEREDGGRLVFLRARGYAGYGKYFSRFLYLLPDSVLSDVRKGSAAPEGAVLAEISGDAAFNANLRPPICECELEYPTGDRIGCPEALQIHDLVVRAGDGPHLDVVHPASNRRILPLDLGFLNPLARPPLYRLLRGLGPASGTYLPIPSRPWGDEPDWSDGNGLVREVVRRPRITFEGKVVLSRECWFVPVECLPVQETDESDADFFLRVCSWRALYGIPELSYVRLERRRAPKPVEGVTPEPPKGKVGDLTKPQYMDLASPPMVRLLERYAALGSPWVAGFEECLPGRDGLATDSTGRAWVTEGIVQMEMEAPTGSDEVPDADHDTLAPEAVHVEVG